MPQIEASSKLCWHQLLRRGDWFSFPYRFIDTYSISIYREVNIKTSKHNAAPIGSNGLCWYRGTWVTDGRWNGRFPCYQFTNSEQGAWRLLGKHRDSWLSLLNIYIQVMNVMISLRADENRFMLTSLWTLKIKFTTVPPSLQFVKYGDGDKSRLFWCKTFPKLWRCSGNIEPVKDFGAPVLHVPGYIATIHDIP